jgi:hypothetical protein
MIRRALVGAYACSCLLMACSGGSDSSAGSGAGTVTVQGGTGGGGGGSSGGGSGGDGGGGVSCEPANGPGGAGAQADVLWNYHTDDGAENPVCTSVAIGDCGRYVFAGFHGGGGRMFAMDGAGVPLWEIDPSAQLRVAAAETADVFYAVSSDGYKVHRLSGSSGTPLWTYDGVADGYSYLGPTFGEKALIECTPDGQTLAVAAATSAGGIAILFFHADSPTPFSVFETTDFIEAQDLHISVDGSKCLLHARDFVYRVDVASHSLESSYEDSLDGEAACFAMAPDASNVVRGLGRLSVRVWDGSGYSEAWHKVLGASDAGFAAAEAADGEELVVALMKNGFASAEVQRYARSAGNTPVWSYAVPPKTGTLQQQPSDVAVSADGQWIAVGLWGADDDSHPEFFILRDSAPAQPLFSIDTVGSVNDVDITANGRYAAAAAKGTHANTVGSGCDLYAVELRF